MTVAAILFLVSCSAVLYVLFAYPLLLKFLSARHRQPVLRKPCTPSVTVLLPVRNGERWLRRKLQSILTLDYPRDLMQVIVISNGSTDATMNIAREFAGEGVEVLNVPGGGKAAALNAGLTAARGEILLMTDVRQALDPPSLRNLTACFADPAVGVASGELIIMDGETREEASVGLYWKYEKWIRNRLSDLDSVPGATGCIYAMRRELARPLPPFTLLDDVFLPLTAFFRGYRVIFEPSARAYDYPTALDSEFHRKVRTLAGVYQVIGFYPQLLNPLKNRIWLHFVSHKLGRLLLPWALMTIFLSSFGLPAPWRMLVLGAQVLFYATAALDAVVSDRSLLKRLTAPIRTFVVLMASGLWAVRILFVPASRLWGETKVQAARSHTI